MQKISNFSSLGEQLSPNGDKESGNLWRKFEKNAGFSPEMLRFSQRYGIMLVCILKKGV